MRGSEELAAEHRRIIDMEANKVRLLSPEQTGCGTVVMIPTHVIHTASPSAPRLFAIASPSRRKSMGSDPTRFKSRRDPILLVSLPLSVDLVEGPLIDKMDSQMLHVISPYTISMGCDPVLPKGALSI